VGNLPTFGDWDLSRAVHLKWSDGHIWSTTLQVPVGQEVCFKIVKWKEEGGKADWEGGDDRKFTALGPDYGLNISCKFNATDSTKIEAFKLGDGAKSAAPAPAAKDAQGGAPAANGNGATSSRDDKERGVSGSKEREREREKAAAGTGTRAPASASLSSYEEVSRSTSAWVGKDAEFVRSRQEKKERQGTWRLDGLQGAERELVAGDQNAHNWLGKLGLLKQVLVDAPHMMRPSLEELAAAYVYATWVNTGAIECTETGGHHRPNHHSGLALQMFRSLEWVIGDAGVGAATSGGEARVVAARRMHTRLPSISGEFRVSTPLTRIRDIAHRNDIPKNLKDEIKHTLQNKLHRSAGPEDLVATEAMLARVTARPGEYPDAFVHEFRLFTAELREFFNASGLLELLDTTLPSLDSSHKEVVGQFKSAMAALDKAGEHAPLDDLMAALFMGTQARAYYTAGLSAGLRNDVGDEVLAMRQRWRLAEIRIEDYVFVLLSRVIQQLEDAGGAVMLAKGGGPGGGAWRVAAAALTNGLRHLGLSQYATKELLVLENELEAWLGPGGPMARGGREGALRAKATAERCQRLASQYSDVVMSVYCAPAARLGGALDVPEHMARIFGESEVRASVAFQVSKLAGILVRALRAACGMDAWDGLVTGDSVGRLVAVESLSPECMEQATRGHSDPVVLLVARADGDEEVGPLGKRLAGVVLRQELPHLSHLGVRARQEGVTFAMCDDSEFVRTNVQPLTGKMVRLSVASDKVTLEATDGTTAAARARARSVSPGPGQQPKQRAAAAGAAGVSSTRKASSWEVVPLADALTETCGAKAAKCGELEALARDSTGLFTTPPGVVLPFGLLELAVAAGGVSAQFEFEEALRALERPDLEGAALDAACARMQRAVEGAVIPPDVLDRVASAFGASSSAAKGRPAKAAAKAGSSVLLAVRSSANVEDLAGMSAAGLYESKVGVPAASREALATAITAVWSSLYTRRAVMSRRTAGVAQHDAAMAVLVMELVAPDVSFVLHTARPSDANAHVLLAELAPGQGETLASGTRGTPWRLEVDKRNSKVDTLAFANFSRALVHPSAVPVGLEVKAKATAGAVRYKDFDETKGGRTGGSNGAGGAASGLVEVEVDYSKQRLSTDDVYREGVARQLARVGMLIENFYGKEAQDIEGGLVPAAPDGKTLQVVVFQTRPQN